MECKKVLVLQVPKHFDGGWDCLGQFVCDLRKSLEPQYEIVVCTDDMRVYYPTHQECVTIIENTIDYLMKDDPDSVTEIMNYLDEHCYPAISD